MILAIIHTAVGTSGTVLAEVSFALHIFVPFRARLANHGAAPKTHWLVVRSVLFEQLDLFRLNQFVHIARIGNDDLANIQGILERNP